MSNSTLTSPYSNPRVHAVVNDGRAFLENTTDKYDLIIFALPDSLTLTSSNTSLRLESFLLTQDLFKDSSLALNQQRRYGHVQLLPANYGWWKNWPIWQAMVQ